MEFGVVIFGILFTFLIITLIIIIVSLFRKERYGNFKPQVSIVVPCYNEWKTIQKCLEAILNSEYPKEALEIIVVDDGSSDRTLEILREYKRKLKNFLLIENPHQGKAASLTNGVQRASHEFILAVDADTFVAPNSLKLLVQPFQDGSIGATNGSCLVYNTSSLLAVFQNIEYYYNNLLRKSFSTVFRNGIWFFGAFACYRKSVLEKIRYFKKDTLTEDMDIAMEIYNAGYKTVNVSTAIAYTIVPNSVNGFLRQRIRWWCGALQTLHKNRNLFSFYSNPSILFLFVSQYWWTLYAFISLPLIAYQIYYWLPYNTTSILSLGMYIFRWMSLAGPIYVIYKIPIWGISVYSIFGVAAGVISTCLIVWAIYLYRDRITMKNAIGIFFYFIYTLLLNVTVLMSTVILMLIKYGKKKRYFIK